ncbi:hypothetical protein Psta_0345 [Pirellula staleyi DSM 6068]|uniref:Uncharacterized protein n=1 Tax=Pirellula staleyi (strain ATCC 27377 / DSM 6068 / ICPB 4128) TaxID=530564 RepID=D2R2C6_PIRSD|nr:hypothetical protein Psta_0345 [Pirellula staleyi DSM 6068]
MASSLLLASIGSGIERIRLFGNSSCTSIPIPLVRMLFSFEINQLTPTFPDPEQLAFFIRSGTPYLTMF